MACRQFKGTKAGLEVCLESERAGLDEHFKALANATLQSNSESFLTIAQEKLKSAQNDNAHELEKKTQAIAAMVEPVQKHLLQLNGVVEQLSGRTKPFVKIFRIYRGNCKADRGS
ncbi:MAG: hypothetical protein R3D88_03965 [Alphaproteobacteria bacterium]